MRKTVNKQKIAQERSYNRKYTVKNNCVPPLVNNPYEKTDKDGKPYIEWKTVKAKQPKNLTKGKCFVKKDGKKLRVPSEQGLFNKKYTHVGINCHSKEYIDKYVEQKLKKWERKNPCPIKLDGIQKDMFESEFLNPWKQQRKEAEKKAYKFAIQVYGQFSLVGRFKKDNTDKYEEYSIGSLKDIDGSTAIFGGINHCPEKVPIIKVATMITDKTKNKLKNLVSMVIQDPYNKQGRIILPKIAA